MEQSDALRRPFRLTADNPDIALDAICLDDVPELYALIDRNRARLREWLPWVTPEYDIEHARRFVEDRQIENARGTALTCVVRFREHMAGAIGLHSIDLVNRASSIGYWIDGSFSGRGIVTSACRTMIATGFRDYGLHRIEIRCAVENHRSCAIPLRLRLREEGILRDAGWLHHRWVSLRVFSVLEDEWR